jgi:hypothetical protein
MNNLNGYLFLLCDTKANNTIERNTVNNELFWKMSIISLSHIILFGRRNNK